jgi:hypothetical protein
MTINALLAYLGIALAFLGAAFIVLAILRPQRRRLANVEESVDVLRHRAAVLANRRANAYCAAILLAVAVTAEVVSFARGGPAVGESSGNALGGFLAISLATVFCLIGCLVARHFILVHLRRNV